MMNNRFQDKLLFISTRVEHAIKQIYKDVMEMLPEELNDQRIQITRRFDELIVSLNNDLSSMENTVNDIQINLLLAQIEARLEKFKKQFSTSTLTLESFNPMFSELTECIQDSFKIMSTISKHTSMKTNKLSQDNDILYTQVYQLHTDLKVTKDQQKQLEEKIQAQQKQLQEKIQAQQKQLQEKIQALEEVESKRLNKERKNQKQILIRDLFKKARKRLCQELQHKDLSNIGFKILFNLEIDYIKISSDHISVFEVLKKVAEEFGIDAYHMLIYLREKEKSNDTFHLNEQINKYATSCKRTKNYNLNDFLEISDMHSFDEKDYLLLQPVFIRVCQIINQDI